MEQAHIVKKFDKNIKNIKTAIAEMGRLVARQISDASAVLSSYDAVEAERIITFDRIINGLNKDIFERAEILIVRRQPMALDLRQALAPINIAGELERIGDHAKSTAKRAHIIDANPPDRASLGLIAKMSEIVQAMLGNAMIAYDKADLDLAAEIMARDKEVDALHKELLQAVIDMLPKQPDQAESMIHLVLISRNFERIGDHVSNIARYVHHIETGDDLKASEKFTAIHKRYI